MIAFEIFLKEIKINWSRSIEDLCGESFQVFIGKRLAERAFVDLGARAIECEVVTMSGQLINHAAATSFN